MTAAALPTPTVETVRHALDGRRYETARRLALALQAAGDDTDEVRLLLHEALRRLGDISAARRVLTDAASLLETCRGRALLAEDSFLLTRNNSYRTSEEKARGLTLEEYEQKHDALADEGFAAAEALVKNDADRAWLAGVLHRCKRDAAAEAMLPPVETPAKKPTVQRGPVGRGALAGRLTFADGAPMADAAVTLGLPTVVEAADPTSYFDPGMHYRPRIDRPDTLTTTTDADGRYRFDDVPAGAAPFLCVTLSGDKQAVQARFVGHDIAVQPNAATTLDATVAPWQSAPPEPFGAGFAERREWRGATLKRLHEVRLRNPFHYDFPTQPLEVELPPGVPADPRRLRLFCSEDPDKPVAFQVHGNTIVFMANLPGLAAAAPGQTAVERCYALFGSDEPLPPDERTPHEWLQPAGDDTVELDTGVAAFRLAHGEGAGPVPPLHAVRGVDGVWRGKGRWVLPDGVTLERWQSECTTAGPVFCELRLSFTFTGGRGVAWTVRAYRGEETLLVIETSAPIDGLAFEFSLREFHRGRGYLQWCPENGSVHWSDLTAEDRELARLQESVPWWIPPSGFAWAVTADGLTGDDYLAVFTRQRGAWIDRHFASICHGPGDDRREWDWSYPEMVGSTVSMITAHSRADGDVVFRFAGFDGERRWGLMASSFAANDGPHKRLSRTQHKYSSPRLQEFKDWQLDTPDRVERPSVVTRRGDLPALREKKNDPRFAPFYRRMKDNPYPHGRAGRGLCALIENDPVELWMLKREIVEQAPIRSRMTLLGREYGDMYSPVGARPITPWVENYDLIAATGVFTAAEERRCRAFLMLMGHLYMQEDLMNWRFNSRNANFEADRVDVVGAAGLAFRGNPDADAMVEHAAALMESSLEIYCTPGSGKWYENPVCYYLHAASCRLNLAWHLRTHGLLDSTTIPRLKDFLAWGPTLLTPRMPIDHTLLCDGGDAAAYDQAVKVRRIPPIGDHAHLGQWIGEFNALFAKAYAERDPDLAHLLRWAYAEGGRDGGHFNNYPLYFVHVEEEDLIEPQPLELLSRRLEGFGALFRGNVNTPHEFYCLFKLGPGGYRYHRTEGSIILFADGKPLIYDGGEGGETWRHTTLSFGETHAPLAAGHIERFFTGDAVDFAQGVNPKALGPGEPVFLSDSCEHHLVDEARRRFNEPHPANSRACLWVKDDYLILHDQLDLPADLLTHWHLQAVADSHEELGPGSVRLRGRYGCDLQVILPGQTFDDIAFTQDPMLEPRRQLDDTFTMRHLQASAVSPDHVLAVLRPLPTGLGELAAERTPTGRGGVTVRVTGDGLDDWHALDRHGTSYTGGGITFRGRYASLLRRGSSRTLSVIDGESLAADGVTLRTRGVAACLTVDLDTRRFTLEVQGDGRVSVTGLDAPLDLTLTPADGRVRLTR